MPQDPEGENVRWGYGGDGYHLHMLGLRYLKDAQMEMPRNQGGCVQSGAWERAMWVAVFPEGTVWYETQRTGGRAWGPQSGPREIRTLPALGSWNSLSFMLVRQGDSLLFLSYLLLPPALPTSVIPDDSASTVCPQCHLAWPPFGKLPLFFSTAVIIVF